MHAKSLQFVWLCDPMDCVACQAPLSLGLSRQEYWNRLPRPPPGDPPDPGIECASPMTPRIAGGFFTTEPAGKANFTHFTNMVFSDIT